jgi:hypothetical protein
VVPVGPSTRPLIRPLSKARRLQQASRRSCRAGQQLPPDPSRGGALKALIQWTNLIHIFGRAA